MTTKIAAVVTVGLIKYYVKIGIIKSSDVIGRGLSLRNILFLQRQHCFKNTTY